MRLIPIASFQLLAGLIGLGWQWVMLSAMRLSPIHLLPYSKWRYNLSDVEAATKAGVWVARVRSRGTGNAESVAEHAVLMMLNLSRHISQARQSFEAERWGQPEGQALFGKTAVIVGLGDVGTALAVRLRALGMRLLASTISSKRACDTAYCGFH
jgi:phosphoglycerate dehydrogenase-like enzyme